MKLWLLTQSENTGYDTYSAAVVCAKDEAEARHIHPSGDDNSWSDVSLWCKTPKAVNVELLGTAKPGSKKGVVVASFHAG